MCDQVDLDDQVVPAHQVGDIDEVHELDPVHQVDHKDQHTGDFGRLWATLRDFGRLRATSGAFLPGSFLHSFLQAHFSFFRARKPISLTGTHHARRPGTKTQQAKLVGKIQKFIILTRRMAGNRKVMPGSSSGI